MPPPDAALSSRISAFPKHHPGMLLVKIRPRQIDHTPGVVSLTAALPTSGAAMLQQMTDSGEVRRAVQTPPTGAARSRPAAMTTMGGPATSSEAPTFHLIELDDVTQTDSMRERLQSARDVESVSPVAARYLIEPSMAMATAKTDAPAAEPTRSNPSWNLARIDWATARERSPDSFGESVHVAVLDTGVDPDHPDLQPYVERYVHNYHVEGAEYDLVAEDIHGHGSHVSGIICAETRFEESVAGVCSPRVCVYKVFDDKPLLIESRSEYVYVVDPIAYRQALNACYNDEQIRVINLSLGGSAEPDEDETALFADLHERVCVVAASGNTGGADLLYPAAIPTVLAVGATDPNDRLASFSTTGDHLWMCAPGDGVKSTLPTYPGNVGFDAVRTHGGFEKGDARPRATRYDTWGGTSMAAPAVSGAIAWLLSLNPNLTTDNIRRLLKETADNVGGVNPSAHHRGYGWGRLNVAELLR